MVSFVSKMMNRLVGERDYSAQGVCHLLLGLLLQEDSRVVRSVDDYPSSTTALLSFLRMTRLLSRRGLPMKNISSVLKTWKLFHISNSWSNGTPPIPPSIPPSRPSTLPSRPLLSLSSGETNEFGLLSVFTTKAGLGDNCGDPRSDGSCKCSRRELPGVIVIKGSRR
jgi:hypothetical protein